MYWVRVVAGVLAGILSGYTHWALPQPIGGVLLAVLVYLPTLAVPLVMLRDRGLPRRKKFLHGVGSYSIWWFLAYSIYLTIVLS